MATTWLWVSPWAFQTSNTCYSLMLTFLQRTNSFSRHSESLKSLIRINYWSFFNSAIIRLQGAANNTHKTMTTKRAIENLALVILADNLKIEILSICGGPNFMLPWVINPVLVFSFSSQWVLPLPLNICSSASSSTSFDCNYPAASKMSNPLQTQQI